MNPSGIARTEIDVTDLSQLINTGLKGITGVVGVTERGEANTPTLVGTWPDYERKFGGLLQDNIFPLLCKRALERGAKLKISRLSPINDADNTLEVTFTKAKNNLDYISNSGQLGAEDIETQISFTASNPGAWGNTLLVDVSPAVSGNDGCVDIGVNSFEDESLNYVVKDVKWGWVDINSPGLVDFNNRSKLVKVYAYSSDEPPFVGAAQRIQLENGSSQTDDSTFTDAQWLGTEVDKTGLHSFDGDKDITRICLPAVARRSIDEALASYATLRGDIIAVTRTPIGLTGEGAVDYRMGNSLGGGSLSSVPPIDSWQTLLFHGDLLVTNPLNNQEIEIPSVGDILGIMSSRDNKSKEWFSFSGSKRGRITNALGVPNNLGSAALQLTASNVDSKGINMVIDHTSFGIVSWGNSTLHRQNTLLKHANVAELMVFLIRGLKPIIETELFEPNDIETWATIHRKVVPFLELVKSGRGIWDYVYQGDQDIDDISEAEVNTSENIDAGQYIFNLFVKPKVALKYIGLKVAVTNSGVDFSVITKTNLD